MSEQNPILISRQRPESKAWAIKAMCAHCMGCTPQHLEAGFREAIRDCTADGCPLYPHRPYVDSGPFARASRGSNRPKGVRHE